MTRQRISFRDPVWLIPMVIVALGCSVQSLHMLEHNRYCKTDADWRALYSEKSSDSLEDADDS
ncbi:putative conserved lipoprotein [Synechococcus sp. RS9915]|nr:putative conserved lipoprotein [Synechococcus sp. RS9915]